VGMQVAALAHRQVVEHGRCWRGEILRLYSQRNVLLDQCMLGHVLELCAKCLPDIVIVFHDLGSPVCTPNWRSLNTLSLPFRKVISTTEP